MAKKKKTNTKRHLRSVDPSPRRTTTAIRNDQMLDALTGDFIDWYDPGNPDPSAAVESLEMVRGLIEACGVIAPETTATSFPAWAVEQTIDAYFAAAGDNVSAAEEFARSWHGYLHYLDDSDRWTGSDEDFEESHEILSDAGEPALPDIEDIEVPELSDPEQVDAFSQLALIRYSTSLLEWIGTGREVTQTGVLRLKDVAAAADCVGVSVRVPRTRKTAADALPGLQEPDTKAGPVVRSMHQVPVLSTLWPVLQDADLISVSRASVNTSARADRLLHGQPAEKAQVCRELVVTFLRASLAEDEQTGFFDVQPEVASLVTAILAAGTTERAMPRDRLDELVAESSGDLLGSLVASAAQRQLEQFTTAGLLLPGPDYEVAPVVIQCVAALMDEITRFADDDLDENPWGTPTVTRADDGRVHQVKISLRHATPPIWRRVLVPSSISLAQLHAVIQRCFEWDDDHLHAFYVTRGKRVTTYAPAGPYLDDSLDEASAVLGDVTARAGTTLTYLYDFGDSWEHRIEVEQVVDDDGQDLPVCTDGRRAAPHEDSGGVWGWESLLATVNDPSSENHEEMRDWLGLEAGQSLDGKAFDRDAVNRRLSVLRG